MKVAVFDTHQFEKNFFQKCNEKFHHEITYFSERLNKNTTSMSKDFPCVCVFVNDQLNKENLESLFSSGVRLIALRSAGFNHVDLETARRLGLKVVRVPEYSPYAVAEHAVALLLTLNRKTHKAYNRVRESNFSLNGLIGHDLHGKTVGVIGTGKIGAVFCKIMSGFGSRVIAYDLKENSDLKKIGVEYKNLDEVLTQSDVISLHVPLNSSTKYILNKTSIGKTKKGVIIINTGRGALIETKALIDNLKNGHIGSAGLDVYEEEDVFFEDHSDDVIQDDLLMRLLTFPNVLLTSHQAFLTEEALMNIATVTLQNISDYENQKELKNQISI